MEQEIRDEGGDRDVSGKNAFEMILSLSSGDSVESRDETIWAKIKAEKERQQGLRKKLSKRVITTDSEIDQPPPPIPSASDSNSAMTPPPSPQMANELMDSTGSFNYNQNDHPTKQPAKLGVEPTLPSSRSPSDQTKSRRSKTFSGIKNLFAVNPSKPATSAAAAASLQHSDSQKSGESFQSSKLDQSSGSNKYGTGDPLSTTPMYKKSSSGSSRHKTTRQEGHSGSTQQRKNVNIKSSKRSGGGAFNNRNFQSNKIVQSPSSSKHQRKRASLSNSTNMKEQIEVIQQQAVDLQRKHEEEIASSEDGSLSSDPERKENGDSINGHPETEDMIDDDEFDDDLELGQWTHDRKLVLDEKSNLPMNASQSLIIGDIPIERRLMMERQESQMSRLSTASKKSRLTYGSVREIDPTQVTETERWVYIIACCLGIISISAIGFSVLFVFGALGPQISASDRVQSQLEYLSNDISVFQDASSPQSLALNWLMEVDGSGIDVKKDQARREARYSLAVLFFGTSDSAGWKDSLFFLSDKHECEWHKEVVSEGTRTEIGVGCTSNQTVSTLKITNNGLRGEVPFELSGLSSLEVLNLEGNSLTGTIPRFNFSKLEVFELARNRIEGDFPASLATLSTLRVLDVSANDLSSTIPTEIESLTGLEVFHAASNSLTGKWNTNSGIWLELRDLNLSGNSLGGSIQFVEKFPRMQRVDLSSNEFTGTVPSNVGNLTDLRSINIADNSLVGNIPTTLGSLAGLESFQASSNLFSGAFPWSFFEETNVLVEVIVSGNSLSGFVPEDLSRFTNLEVIQFGRNNMEGDLPRFIGPADRLRVVDLSSNQLTGSLPSEWGFLQSLEVLNVAANSLSGTLPATLGKLTSLLKLRLQANNFEGEVPKSLGSLERLEMIGLQNNEFFGDIEFLCVSDPTPVISADCAGSMPNFTCTCCEFCF